MSKILQYINSPNDLRKLSTSDLPLLAHEIRKKIIEVISENGGHLASSLGTVELILALHYVFKTPEDKILYDVGHQTYAHKIITGRCQEFSTIRQAEGLSGFPKKSESPYDVLDAGHASTSISAALGLASARDLQNKNNHIIALIGDGALTGGMAMEALNHAGSLKTTLIVILNDNNMSISPNVGAMASFFSRKFTTKGHVALKKEVKSTLNKIPKIGQPLVKLIQRSKESLKGLLISPSLLFEAFGFHYIGIIDGHCFYDLIEALENTKNLSGPILLHVQTKKGKGYLPAEEDPCNFHGVGKKTVPCLKTSDKTDKIAALKKTSYTDIFSSFIMKAAAKDERIVAITAAMAPGTGLVDFFKSFPNRAFDVGIAEQHALTYAAGLALGGLKPIVPIYSTFLQRAFDQIFHDICLPNLPVIMAVDRAGLVGEDGPTHHGTLDLAYLRILPNMVLMAPKDEHEMTKMFELALNLNQPSAIRYPRGEISGRLVEESLKVDLEMGKGEILHEGKDLVIFALGSLVWPAVMAAEILKAENIHVTVVNLRFLKPLDENLIIKTSQNIPFILCVEEGISSGGLSSVVSETLSKNLKQAYCFASLGLEIDKPAPQGDLPWLKEKLGLDVNGIIKKAKKLISHSKIN